MTTKKRNRSTRPVGAPILVALIALFPLAEASAEEKLQRGQDRIEVPAVGEGLCLHNLFQSDMVLQRDKPIRVWGWAEPGEKIAVSFAGHRQAATLPRRPRVVSHSPRHAGQLRARPDGDQG